MKKRIFISYPIVLLVMVAGCSKSTQDQQQQQQQQPPPPPEKKWMVTTVAGSDTITGYAEGAALSAKFSNPTDVAVAANGTLYVTDYYNHRIRKIANGQVSTLAGNGNGGIVNADGAAAQFIVPSGMAIDAAGNLFTCDGGDARIRKTTPGGTVSTYAGTSIGYKDGAADIAQFNDDGYVVADAQGNVYVSDEYNHRIRKISVAGVVSTVAGDGTGAYKEGNGTNAQFKFPTGIAIDAQGNLYVADRLNFRIRKITPAGDVSTFSGMGTQGFRDGDAAVAQFNFVIDIAADGNGNLYVIDGNFIRKITPQGTVSTIAGDATAGYKDGEGLTARFHTPTGLGTDAQGNIYVADLYNQRIRKISFE